MQSTSISNILNEPLILKSKQVTAKHFYFTAQLYNVDKTYAGALEPSALGWRTLTAYVPLRATMQRKRPCIDLSTLYNGSLTKSFAFIYNLFS